MTSLLPSEEWPPYRWLWTHLALARDPATGEPTPWTHGLRRRWRVWLPLFLVALGWLVFGGRGSWWRVLLAFGLGALAGHAWW